MTVSSENAPGTSMWTSWFMTSLVELQLLVGVVASRIEFAKSTAACVPKL